MKALLNHSALRRAPSHRRLNGLDNKKHILESTFQRTESHEGTLRPREIKVLANARAQPWA